MQPKNLLRTSLAGGSAGVVGMLNWPHRQGSHRYIILQRKADADGQVGWTVHYVDGTDVRAHQHAAGAKAGEDHSLGRSQGGFGTKVHLRVEGRGKPVASVLTTGHQHEASVFEQ